MLSVDQMSKESSRHCTTKRHPLLRDYVNETGTLTTLEGTDAHRAHYQAFFEKYEVRSVDVLSLVAEDWYVFAEVRFTVSARDEPGPRLQHRRVPHAGERRAGSSPASGTERTRLPNPEFVRQADAADDSVAMHPPPS